MIQELVKFIRELYGYEGSIPLHEPRFIGLEKQYLNECIDSTYVSSVGKFVGLFEQKIAEYTGSTRAVACVNGTEALHLSLILAGVTSGDEVLTQPLTFIATTNAISYTGAVPVFIDVDRDTLGLSPTSLESFLMEYGDLHEDGNCYNKKSGRKIAACVPMHTFGHPAGIVKIMEICEAYRIPVIEDAAESLGSKYKNKHTGTFGKLGILSFNGNKIITTGGGGMILTNENAIGDLAKHLTTQARLPHKWEFRHDRVGYNYRMPNLNAALGLAQLESIEFFLSKKRELAKSYSTFFKKYGIEFINEPAESQSNYWLNTIIANDRKERDQILEYTNEHGIMTRPAWTLMNHLPMYQDLYHPPLTSAEYLGDRIVNLPSSVILEKYG